MNPRSFTVSGIIIRMADLGESDRFITVLTPDRGKLTCIGKNLRTLKSRRNSQLELFSKVQIQFWKSRNNYYLQDCKLEERHPELKKNLASLASVAFIVEATEKLTVDENHIPGLYDLLEETLSLIEFYPKKHEVLREAYIIKLLSSIGTISSFRTCSECREKLPSESAFLDENHTTIHCVNCAEKKSSHLREIPLETLKLMHFILAHQITAVLKLKMTRQHINIIDEFGRTFLKHDLHYPLKSEAFLNTYG
ncbi:DNA repair protein RecO [Candidatus Peregrinibacteria bacterium]|jgi:DNA repair protein RecO (recombination protein O)|nr:DNA repair protein RecO [Candidatus Peregrinibacteria bacterium]MBT7484421.1 DNA repair protein RecO [Candidatus Peregrinibacteria bacterium]MBT7703581.1 DNA repair protein RecO [Candidatus Peregrinibacteria bacterium]